MMRVGVVGLGYVGSRLAAALLRAAHAVVGVDVAQGPLEAAREELGIEAGLDYALLADCDAVVICVPTPLSVHREPDLGPLRASARALAPHVRAGMLVVFESTTFPGTTREELRPLLEEADGLVAGEDFHLVYSPERIDPGREGRDFAGTPKLVGGLTRPAASAPRRSTRASAPGWSAWARPRSRSSPSCWRTSSAP